MEEIAAAAGEVFFDLKADKRNIFIFTSSGKPIFAKCGQDDDLVTTFGFLQAVISIVLNSGDILKSITAEPESILMRELDFLYQQIIFILTKKVHSVLESNPSTDLRNLLGSDSDRILNSASGNQFSSSSVILESVPIVFTNKGFREEILSSLKTVIDKSGAAIGLLMMDEKLLGAYFNQSIGLQLSTIDMILLLNFVARSQSLNSGDQHWVPVCLPHFNAGGYLQAFISNIKLGQSNSATATVIMIATSADPEIFKELLYGKRALQDAYERSDLTVNFVSCVEDSTLQVNHVRDEFGCYQFLFKFNGLSKGKSNDPKSSTLSQYVSSKFRAPIVEPGNITCVWKEYQKLSLRLRRATARPEAAFFILDAEKVPGPKSIIQDFLYNRKSKRKSSDSIDLSLELKLDSKSISSSFDESILSVGSLPNPDHSLIISSIPHKFIAIAIANFDCELFVSFPSSITLSEAISQADSLLRKMKSSFVSAF